MVRDLESHAIVTKIVLACDNLTGGVFFNDRPDLVP